MPFIQYAMMPHFRPRGVGCNIAAKVTTMNHLHGMTKV